jgi:hypothetical protein
MKKTKPNIVARHFGTLISGYYATPPLWVQPGICSLGRGAQVCQKSAKLRRDFFPA